MIKRVVIGFIVLVAFVSIAIAASWKGLHWWAKKPLNIEADFVLQIQRGQTLTATVDQLTKLEILSVPELALAYSKLEKKTNIQFGEYSINAGLSWAELNDLLISGDVIERSVTLVEGRTIRDALQSLQSHPKITATLQGVADPKLIELLPEHHKNPEGWFFADTYSFHAGATDLSILKRAHEKMRQSLEGLWSDKTSDLPFESPYEALILASIIERETGVPEERPVISGVFTRRLKQNMRLQTDPTVIYGLGDDYQGNITRQHLKQPTDYNTYVISGLPPTPIALVGQAALHAAFHPDDGKSLYFVAKGDGSHKFSETLSEHNQAVREFQILKRRSDYRSSPETKQ